MVFGHYLIVQRWQPYFQPSMAHLTKSSLWIRLLELPLEFYDEGVLFSIGKLLGKPLHLYHNTVRATRTKYARLCIEVDLSRLLVSRIDLGRITQIVEYESVYSI
ncbi:DUF4283 domain-containing protein [Cephalotus follicularis]|uniref:DUF4283 domain-containing protein n=1 Tax=Cephalotus follicularis TaxID=3775 RepID=A0A1Q3CEB9_CEPFO|nr:DUF4283 domain-containing protein [Cephalotus follicularis]